jgi:AraC family transcriptional regulator
MLRQDGTSAAPGQDERLLLAMDYIHAHLGEPISVGDIARAAGVATPRFSRLFKTAAGVAPRRYLTEARFARAKELIRNSAKNLTQIAAESGFTDQSHMNHIFRRRVGMTPKAFRRS